VNVNGKASLLGPRGVGERGVGGGGGISLAMGGGGGILVLFGGGGGGGMPCAAGVGELLAAGMYVMGACAIGVHEETTPGANT
jgi:hypothetical protein